MSVEFKDRLLNSKRVGCGMCGMMVSLLIGRDIEVRIIRFVMNIMSESEFCKIFINIVCCMISKMFVVLIVGVICGFVLSCFIVFLVRLLVVKNSFKMNGINE